jgi:hypothetical protein
MPRIILESHADSPWRVGGVTVEMSGKALGKVAPNSRSDFLIAAGSHALCVRAGGAKSQSIPFRIADQETLTFSCSVSGLIRLEVTLNPLFRRQSDSRFNHIGSANYGRRFGDILPWHVVLGVPETASSEEIRRAYLGAMQKVHPDLTAHMTDVERQVAHQQAQRLNVAYAEAKRKSTG